MEKWSRWRDPGTGISPFTPTNHPFQWRTVLIVVVGIVKFPLIIVLGLLLVALSWLLAPCGGRWAERAFCSPLSRILLGLLGFLRIDTQWTTLRLGRRLRSGIDENNTVAGWKAGDVVVCNFQSPIDLLYLYFRFTPAFAMPAVDSSDSSNSARDQWVLVEWWAVIWNILRSGGRSPLSPLPWPSGKRKPLVQLRQQCKRTGRILFLFPEGSTTNGKALLKPVGAIGNRNDGAVHLLAIRYPYRRFNPAYSAGNALWYTLQLCGQLSNRMQVLYLPDSELSFDQVGGTLSNDVDAAVMESMDRLLRLKRTRLTAVDKLAFVDAWSNYQRI